MADRGSPIPGRQKDDCKYFIAGGSFNSLQRIPPHYRFADDEVPDAGASELERTYERTDFGFVVEHRWREKITNIVTLPGYIKARDELLDLWLPVYTDAIEAIFGKDYDVSRLVDRIRVDGRRFLENVSVIFYDAAVRGQCRGQRWQARWRFDQRAFACSRRSMETRHASCSQAYQEFEEDQKRMSGTRRALFREVGRSVLPAP